MLEPIHLTSHVQGGSRSHPIIWAVHSYWNLPGYVYCWALLGSAKNVATQSFWIQRWLYPPSSLACESSMQRAVFVVFCWAMTPLKNYNGWNLQITQLKRKTSSKPPFLVFYVNSIASMYGIFTYIYHIMISFLRKTTFTRYYYLLYTRVRPSSQFIQ